MDSCAACATVRIDNLSHDGRGVARLDGKAVFVEGALPGESVELMSLCARRRYDEAKVGRFLEVAPTRSQPECLHFGLCGGCALQHLDPAEQLAAKERQLLEVLERIGGVRPRQVFERISGCSYAYRRKARLGVKYVRTKGRVVVGFRERNGRFVTDAQICPVLQAPGPTLPGRLAELINTLSIRSRCPQVEFAAGDTEAAVVFRTLELPAEDDCSKLVEFGRDQKLAIWLQPGGSDSLRLLYGPSLLAYVLPEFHLTLHFLPTDFVQVNGSVNRKLVSAAVSRLGVSSSGRILELFSGIGNFSLPLSRRAREVVSVEGAPSLVARAKANAQANAVTNVQHHVADLAQPHRNPRWLQGKFDAVLLDPPRSGARALIPSLRRVSPERLLYVSCHPATLARDAGAFGQAGFDLEAVGVVDMFPQTVHAEAMALFVRR